MSSGFQSRVLALFPTLARFSFDRHDSIYDYFSNDMGVSLVDLAPEILFRIIESLDALDILRLESVSKLQSHSSALTEALLDMSIPSDGCALSTCLGIPATDPQ